MNPEKPLPSDDLFFRSPNKTFIKLSMPVLFSLIAEPLTGLVDTAFVSRLGTHALAALGVGTMALSSMFWVFNFLGIGTQTEIAQALGKKDLYKTRQVAGLSLTLAAITGFFIIALFYSFVPYVATLMGAKGKIYIPAVSYLSIRLFGAPAVLTSIAAFGVLRGRMDMKTPFNIYGNGNIKWGFHIHSES